MREASRRTIGFCLGHLAATLLGVGSLTTAWATPMQAELPPAEDAGPREDEVEMDPGSVSVVGREIELPKSFEGLLRAPPVDVQGGSEPAPPEATAAPDSEATTAAPGREAPAVEPGPMEKVLVEHHLRLARLMLRNGDFEGAAGSAGRAVEIAPDAPEPRMELGLALLQLERFAEAEAQLRRALQLGSDAAPLHAALAVAASAQGRPRDAIRHGREALRRDPNLLPAANNLAWLLATSEDAELRDPEESIRIARRALQSTGGESPGILDTLAAGYAAAGRYAEAIAVAERAESLALGRGADELAAEIRQHLERYRAGQAYTGS
jgi:hypothetical protein